MDARSDRSAYYGNAASKSSHKHSSAESQSTLARRRISTYDNQPAARDSNMYRVAYQGTSASESQAQHRARIEAELARITAQSRGGRS
ncbi:hypothetical protein CGCF415_v006564 [Colletotrichum fructicola]|nr:hypothetical protein CGCF415_v006564 [Colletotrichum fructicola]KAF4938878.1 hypothetical protein CGCF245_v004209 [Colletotrichum fructicola]KAF5509332.1 hypothetical protein CGCF413_v003710 [Colletotrichum fructicola]